MTTTYNTGDVRPATSTLVAPSPVLSVTGPDGTTSLPVVTGVPGAYTASYTLTQTGRYLERWVNTVGVQADIVNTLPVDPGFLVSLAEMKLTLNKTSTADDDELRAYIAAATAPIEALAGPVLTRTIVWADNGGRYSLTLPHQPVTTITNILENNVIVSPTGYVLHPNSGVLDRLAGFQPLPWRPGRQNIIITYIVGSSFVPWHVNIAARELVRHWWQYSQQSGRPQWGAMDGTDNPGNSLGVPPSVIRLLNIATNKVPGIA